jgi:hypothetical protein
MIFLCTPRPAIILVTSMSMDISKYLGYLVPYYTISNSLLFHSTSMNNYILGLCYWNCFTSKIINSNIILY